MGGELEARLFFGPKCYKTYTDWVFLLLRSREKFIADAKQSQEYFNHVKRNGKPSDDEIFSWYYIDLDEDVLKLEKILEKDGLNFVHEYNYMEDYYEEIRIGRLLPKDTDPKKFKHSEEDIQYWKKYGIHENDLMIFCGMDGEIC